MSVSPVGDASSKWDQAEYSTPLGFDDDALAGETRASYLGFDNDTTAYFKELADGPLGDATPSGTSYLLYESWGGTWSDAEKSPSNTEDDLLCWAGAASNVLEWTGWGLVDGMTTTDDIFAYFQDHWTDEGGLMEFGWDWWFDGTNNSQGWSGWAQEDVDGGGFYPTENFNDYFHSQSNDAMAMAAIDDYVHNGYGVTLGLYGPGGHAITCWGYNYNPDNPSEYLGLWVTDSDDSKYLEDGADRLRYYEVEYVGSQWFLQDYYGSDAWYIGVVQGLAPNEATPVAPPAANEIHGTVWEDTDGDGAQNNGETGLADQLVYLDENDNGAWDQQTLQIASVDVAKTLYDQTTVSSTLDVAGLAGRITDVNVTLDITHTYASDLEVYLVSASGTRVELFSDIGGSGDNFTATTLDDEAATSITQAGAPFTGTFRPEGLLADFDGESANGTWTLEITDQWSQDQGTLNSWSLDISTAETSTRTDAAGDFAFTDLADGDYRVRMVAPEDWTLSLPGDGYHDVSLADGTVFETADFGLTQSTPTDLGTVDFLQVEQIDLGTGSHWYSCRTAHDGYLTVATSLDGVIEGVQVTLYDQNLNEVALSTASDDGQRVDWSVEAGQTYLFRVDVTGDTAVTDLRVANLVQQQGDTVVIHGTAGDDRLDFAAASWHQVTVNGVHYEFDSAIVTTFTFDGLAGNDTAVLCGSDGDDTLVLRPTSATLTGPGYEMAVSNTANIIVLAEGGADIAYLYDSAGDDTLVATPTQAALYGNGFYGKAEGFRYVRAYATAGGTDRAHLYDSAGDDYFVGRSTYSYLHGSDFYNKAEGFRYVRAYATGGGTDRAYLFDSAGNDRFVATPTSSCLCGDGFFNKTEGFRYVRAYATGGGTDQAYLFDSAGDDCLVATPTYGYLEGDDFYNRADGFRYVRAYAIAGGNDQACLYDSTGDDLFVGRSDYSYLYGNGFYNRAEGFRHVMACATGGGDDRVYLYDSVRDDHFEAGGNLVTMSYGASSVSALDFSWVRAISIYGGNDTKTVRAIDYVLRTFGTWTDQLPP